MGQHFAAKTSEASMDEQHILLHFMVQELQCCMYIQDVARIIPLLEMQPVPGAPNYLIGLINLHGMSIMGIDLGLRIGKSHAEAYTVDTPIILCACEEEHVGLVVSEIIGIQHCTFDDMQMRPEFNERELPFEAVVNTKQGFSLLLNIQKVSDFRFCDVDIDTITSVSEIEKKLVEAHGS